jgi:nitrate/TMAO reductase-like tetraheme cytochrome c subunit
MRFRLTSFSLSVVAVGLTVLVLVIGVMLAGTSSSRFCASCKSHVPYVDEYKKSSHSTVNCEQCHTKPGPLFFLTSKLEALQQPIAQITGDYQEPILGYVLNQSCRRCHADDQLFKTISKNGINVNHQHLIQAGFLCMRCHSTVAHGTAVPPGSRTYPVMDQCLICHNNQYRAADGTVATSRCDLCHTKRNFGAQPLTHKAPEWDTRHGAVGVLSTCSACHLKPDACSRCHNGVLMPHPSDWVTSHGADVKANGRASCTQCHDAPKYCLTCHRVPMPHPTDFISTHPAAVANTGAPGCFNCHALDNCQACHEQHASGDPRAHALLNGVPFTPTASPTAMVGGP